MLYGRFLLNHMLAGSLVSSCCASWYFDSWGKFVGNYQTCYFADVPSFLYRAWSAQKPCASAAAGVYHDVHPSAQNQCPKTRPKTRHPLRVLIFSLKKFCGKFLDFWAPILAPVRRAQKGFLGAALGPGRVRKNLFVWR